MNLSDQVRQLENELAEERQRRREALSTLDEVRYVLEQYSQSTSKPWGRTLAKIGALVGIEVRS